MKTLLRPVLVSLFAALAAWGQADANKAQVTGTVTDPEGLAVPKAKVALKNTATGLQREAFTSVEGQYRIVHLDPGEYDVEVTGAGFAVTTVSGVPLTVGSSVNIDLKLQLEDTSTKLDVADTLINNVQPAPSTVIDLHAITDLPINGRRFQEFATLTPTVQVEPSRQQLSFAGQRGVNGNIMVDGADYNQPFYGGIRGGERSAFSFTVPQSAVQEFQSVAAGYSAEYGRSTGGVLNVVTRSGSNLYHGEGFYQNRDRSFSADDPIFHRQPSESLAQLGGAIGGPLISDTLFLFGAIEDQRTSTPATVVFSALSGYTPTAATQEAYNYFKSLEEDFRRENRAWAITGKLDFQYSESDRFSLRYNTNFSREPNSVTAGGALNPFTSNALSSEGTEEDRTHFGTAQYAHMFSPRVVNDLRFSASFEERPRLANAQAVSVTAGPIGSYGARSFLPSAQWDYRTQAQDSLTVPLGRHFFKFGLDLSYLSTGQRFGSNQYGALAFNSSDVDQILGTMSASAGNHRFDDPSVSYRMQIGNLKAGYVSGQTAAFAQDSWRVGAKLTLDLGLRWEGQWNPSVAANNIAVVNRVQSATYPLGGKPDVTQIRDERIQLAPRAGFAWSPFSSGRRVVVRGHAGFFYAATPLLLFSSPTNSFRNPPGDASIQIGPFSSGTMTVYQAFRQAGVNLDAYTLGNLPVIPVDVVARAAGIAAGQTSVDPFFGANLTFMSPDFRNPRSFQTGLGIEAELTQSWVAGIHFNHVNTVHLERNRDWNQPLPQIRSADGRPFFDRTLRPVPSQGQFVVRESSARSLYRAATFQTEFRSERLRLGVFYTLAWNFSDDDNERDATGVGYDNGFNLRPEYNWSSLDARHQVTAHAVLPLMWGVELSAILRARSGQPINALAGADLNGDSYNTDRPYVAPGVPMLRNAFRNRGTCNPDLRLLKTFKLFGDSVSVRLSAELFNFLNLDNVVYSGQANIYGPGIDPATGKPVAVDPRFLLLKTNGDYDPRTTSQMGNPFQAQFGIRVSF